MTTAAKDPTPKDVPASPAADAALPVEAAPTTAPPPKPAKPTGLPDGIVFFCKDCEKIGDVKREGSRYVYTCSTCGTKNVAFGTLRSIERFFRIKEKAKKKEAMAKKKEEDKS